MRTEEEVRARRDHNVALLRACVEQKKPQIIIENIACMVTEDDWVLNDKNGE